MSLANESTQVICCGDPAEAEIQLNGRAFDQVILDINLPDGSGLDLRDGTQ